ncbi:hypothetical protein CALVIDRAFT_180176 [Calocera viscosa TUFC12733]|uniref:Uncharacterized protein n=1 Tax=Calocera viscosa (strain TUFC12733) TaxID=1330018 RepID=A0A167KZT5_CALVF|nr:hypothetical protein CALVIDRAFT_180176 [Calocera viscosa TUFC12733]
MCESVKAQARPAIIKSPHARTHHPVPPLPLPLISLSSAVAPPALALPAPSLYTFQSLASPLSIAPDPHRPSALLTPPPTVQRARSPRNKHLTYCAHPLPAKTKARHTIADGASQRPLSFTSAIVAYMRAPPSPTLSIHSRSPPSCACCSLLFSSPAHIGARSSLQRLAAPPS